MTPSVCVRVVGCKKSEKELAAPRCGRAQSDFTTGWIKDGPVSDACLNRHDGVTRNQ